MAAKDSGNVQVAAAVEAAAAAASISSNGKLPDKWASKVSPGLVLRLHKVSRHAIIESRKKIIEPEVPEVWIEEKSVKEQNPNSPSYLKAMRKWNTDVSIATIDAYIAIGTSLLEKPDYLDDVQSDEWIERLEAAGVEVIKDRKYPRYLAWIKLYAVADDDDLTDLIREAQRYNGLSLEEEVEEAMEGFKSDKGSDTDTEAAAP